MSDQPIVSLVSDDEIQGPAKELFAKMTKAQGGVPKWMRVMANCDDILMPFFGMFKSTMDDSPLNQTLKWKVAMLVSKINECTYCVSVVESKLKGFGLTDEQIKSVTEEPADDRERLAFEFAKNATQKAYNMDVDLIEQVKKEFSECEIVELTAVVGLFSYINRFNDALNILPDID
ncbi:hypothetical protein HN358_01145 [Candidatus Uhrbacteria bacterium]|jgi:uncharacterized peroxidase-related enzyme|nr:hypothetical protein [Candidatus Uhrbacteria bacterium]MBT7717362.1 hypothetical protein [Candidatus Uhrbacteria bacterium]